MLTIKEALNTPTFRGAEIVAGHAGINNEISWVHTVDLPNGRYEYEREGVLLLTAGYGLVNQPERRADLIQSLVDKKFCGMVLCTGYCFDEVPAEMVTQANALDFPIIQSPPELLYINIGEQLLEPSSNPHYILLQKSNEVYANLTELVSKGGNLTALSQMLAKFLNRSIVIEDTSLRVLAHAKIGMLDKMRRGAIIRERNSPAISKRLLKSGIYDRLKAELQPMYVPPMPGIGMTLPRLVAPIVVDREIHGYFWIITDELEENGILDDEHQLIRTAAVQGATVAALIMFKERAVSEAETTLRTNFFDEALSHYPDRGIVQDRARRLNFNLDRDYQILLVHGPPASGGNPRPLLRDVQEWNQTSRTNALLHWHEEKVVLIYQSSGGYELAQTMFADLNHPARQILIGLGNPNQGVDGISQSYREAVETLTINGLLGHKEGIFKHADLGLLHWLYHLPADAADGNSYLHFIKALHTHDTKRKADLVKTLEGYLDNGGSLVETAMHLHIHRNTLVHRIKRIEELTGLDLRNSIHRLNLHVAVKHFRLNTTA